MGFNFAPHFNSVKIYFHDETTTSDKIPNASTSIQCITDQNMVWWLIWNIHIIISPNWTLFTAEFGATSLTMLFTTKKDVIMSGLVVWGQPGSAGAVLWAKTCCHPHIVTHIYYYYYRTLHSEQKTENWFSVCHLAVSQSQGRSYMWVVVDR